MKADLRAFWQDKLSFCKDASNITFFFPTAGPASAGQNLVYMLGYILWSSASIDLKASRTIAVSQAKWGPFFVRVVW